MQFMMNVEFCGFSPSAHGLLFAVPVGN